MQRFATAARFAGLASLALFTVTCDSDQPRTPCTTAHGAFAVKYTLMEGSGACAMLSAGLVGVQPFGRGGPGQAANFDMPPVAIKTEELGNLVGTYGQAVDATKLFSLGAFTTREPGADNLCTLGAMTPAEVTLAAVPAGMNMMGMPTPALPAVTARWEWSNVRFFVTAALAGTIFTGNLTYTQDGCTARYSVRGLYPAVHCTKEVTDPVTMMPSEVRNPALCSPCADPSMGRATGSGINPDIDTACDQPSNLCLPTGEPPSPRAQPLTCPGS